MLYRIVLTIGYRDAYIEFDNVEDASKFATTLLEHYVKPDDEKRIAKIAIEVLDPELKDEEEEDE